MEANQILQSNGQSSPSQSNITKCLDLLCGPLSSRAGGTPCSAPNTKVRKVGPSPLVNSTYRQGNNRLTQTSAAHGARKPPPSGKVSVNRPIAEPLSSLLKAFLFSFFQTPIRRKPVGGVSRKILGEKNTSVASNESVFSHCNTSLASTGSYTDFQVSHGNCPVCHCAAYRTIGKGMGRSTCFMATYS